MILTYTEGTFTEQSLSTISVDSKTAYRVIDGRDVKLQVWDTAGQEQFHTIAKSYFRGAHGVILVFDVTSRVTFDRTHIWMDPIQETTSGNIDIVLVGNKTDLQDRCVSFEQGLDLAKEYNVPYFETSAKTTANIALVFETLARAGMRRMESDIPVKAKHIQITDSDPAPAGQCC
jgi:small GTP-binding protein